MGTLQTSLGTTTAAFDVVFRDRITGEAREPLSTTKLFVIDKGSAASPNPQYEIIYGSHTTSGGVTSFTGVVRGIEFSGVSLAAVTARQKTHIAGAEVGVVDLHYLTSTIVATLKGVGDVTAQLTVADHTARDADITATEGQIIYVDDPNCFEMYKNGAWWLLDPVFADDTARDAAIPSPVNGMSCYNTAEGVHQDYVGGAWANRGTSTTANGSTIAAGKFEKATTGAAGELAAGTTTGGTGAQLVVGPEHFKSTSSGAADEGCAPLINSSGYIPDGFINTAAIVDFPKFGGDGSDGDISGTGVTITGSNNTYIVKQYNNFAPGSNTVTVTPTGCIVHIKIAGTCDLTGTTFDFEGKGGAGGAGGASIQRTTSGNENGNNGSSGSSFSGPLFSFAASTGGQGGSGYTNTRSGGTGSVKTPDLFTPSLTFAQATGVYVISPGGGGGGGGSGGIRYESTGTGTLDSGAGGDGGDGGGCLILEIAGDVTFSSTTVNCNGTAGSNGGNASGTTTYRYVNAGGGGGGGGGGGCFVCLYGGTATGSPTVNVSAGSAGSAGTGLISGALSGTPDYCGGCGGGGGASVLGSGSDGTGVSGDTKDGQAGGASGGNGLQLVENFYSTF